MEISKPTWTKVLIAIILCLVILSLGYIYFNQYIYISNKKYISNWKTYKNIRYDYSIQYPPDETIEVLKSRDNHVTSEVVSFENAQHRSIASIVVKKGKPVTSTLFQWVQGNSFLPLNSKTTIFTEISVANHHALSIAFQVTFPNQSWKEYDIFVERDPNTVLVLGTLVPPDKDDWQKAIFDQMLSTFHFTAP